MVSLEPVAYAQQLVLPPAPSVVDPSALYGRENDLAFLEHLLDQAQYGWGAALTIDGGAGLGKSTLLAATARSARRRSMTILNAAGVESESHLPFAGLHHLLLPLRTDAARLEPRQRRALRAAFGLEATTPDLFGIALATLELLSEAAGRAPVLLIADDTHWMDHPAQDVLAFVRSSSALPFVSARVASHTLRTAVSPHGSAHEAAGQPACAASSAHVPGDAIDEAALLCTPTPRTPTPPTPTPPTTRGRSSDRQ